MFGETERRREAGKGTIWSNTKTRKIRRGRRGRHKPGAEACGCRLVAGIPETGERRGFTIKLLAILTARREKITNSAAEYVTIYTLPTARGARTMRKTRIGIVSIRQTNCIDWSESMKKVYDLLKIDIVLLIRKDL